MREDQERKLKRVTTKIDEGLDHLRKESERELQMAVDNAERRERQIIRRFVAAERKAVMRSEANDYRRGAKEAFECVLIFLTGREGSLNEKRNRQANAQRVNDAVFKGGKR